MDSPGEIREHRSLIPGPWRFLMLTPALFAVFALTAISHNPHEFKAGAPIMVLIIYGCVVLTFNGTQISVDRNGFRLSSGPLPSGAATNAYSKDAVKSVFPRQRYEAVSKYQREYRYYAAVELNDGRWINIRGHYTNWAQASASCMEIVTLWGLDSVSAGRTELPAKRDWEAARIALLWGCGFIACLAWGVYVEVTRGPRYILMENQ